MNIMELGVLVFRRKRLVDYNDLLERLAVSAGDQECLYADAKAAIEDMQVRLAEAEDANKALRVRLGSELERANERLVDLECELYSYADVPRERLEESRRMDELKLRVTQLEAELAAERAAPEPIQCETCQGTGKINERLGGYGFSDPSATCQDCDGSGEIESIHDFRASQWWVKALDEIWGSTSPDVTPDQKRAVAVVHNLLRHVANLGRVTAQSALTPEQAGPVRLTDEQAEKVDEAIREALGDAYDCLRVWNAWSYGTMGPDDFSQVAEDSDRVAEIRNAAAVALGFKLEGEQ